MDDQNINRVEGNSEVRANNTTSSSNKATTNPCATTSCCVGYNSTLLNNGKQPRPIYAYVEQIFDKDEASGAPIFLTMDTGGKNQQYYIISSEFTPVGNCCTQCNIGEGAVFSIDCVQTSLIYAGLVDPYGLELEQITIGNKPINALEMDGNAEYTAFFYQSSLVNSKCASNGSGTPNEMIILQAGPWFFIAKHIFYGKVTYQGTTCNYTLTVIDNFAAGGGGMGNQLEDIVVDYLCIPPDTDKPPVVRFNFTGDVKLLNPSITVESIYSDGCDGQYNFVVQSKVIFTPKIKTEVVAKREICIPQHGNYMGKGNTASKQVGK